MFHNFKLNNIFDGLQSVDQQINVLKEYYNYVEADEKPFGERKYIALERESGTYIPKFIVERFQYVPIIDILTLIMRNSDFRDAIMSERESDNNGVRASFIDGQHFKEHQFLQRYNKAIRFEFYYDEVEVVNPLGSKTVIYEVGVVLYRIQNVPALMNSKLGSIHTACTDYKEDIKKYGFEKLLRPLLRDLKKIEV